MTSSPLNIFAHSKACSGLLLEKYMEMYQSYYFISYSVKTIKFKLRHINALASMPNRGYKI